MFSKSYPSVTHQPGKAITFQIPKSKSAELFRRRQAIEPKFLPSATTSYDISGLGEVDPLIYCEKETKNICTGHCETGLDTDNGKGRLWYSLNQCNEGQAIQITLHNGEDLQVHSKTLEPLSCFIRVNLQGDESRFFQTKVRKHTSNPEFKEHFTFLIPSHLSTPQNMKIVLYQYVARFRPRRAGEILLPLDYSSFSPEQKFEWFH